MEFGLKWVHMAWYELILRQDGALWLRIIFKPLLTPKRGLPRWRRPWNRVLRKQNYLRVDFWMLCQARRFKTIELQDCLRFKNVEFLLVALPVPHTGTSWHCASVCGPPFSSGGARTSPKDTSGVIKDYVRLGGC